MRVNINLGGLIPLWVIAFSVSYAIYFETMPIQAIVAKSIWVTLGIGSGVFILALITAVVDNKFN